MQVVCHVQSAAGLENLVNGCMYCIAVWCAFRSKLKPQVLYIYLYEHTLGMSLGDVGGMR